ncbi:hyaluronoglucosaminidase [Dictyocaulus viviparus]|uniref:Hyaluronoglucosaminidase n=1 Tax=Dictyocaulus viviparus TaxID=29172 RepID=A0A0D8XEU5_DICVI|nr:hyaluronoglucosaminidase [Dictyocaulus viviparus]
MEIFLNVYCRTSSLSGFYGRPWTFEQRKHLFSRLNRLGLNTYVYAPKDDLKHRPQWRIPYNDEEAESAKASDITFVYSLSPGIDIVYSKFEDLTCIKSKLDQVRMLGCESFALLFDDIECEMNETDKQRFSSFVAAQVRSVFVTNEIYEYLGRPRFFFCPTGPRVISRHITVEHVQSVASVIIRKPLIWDNLHANDYDQKRVFMGDFSGRPVALKKEISGLLINPSCKYELNFVPLRTFADWNASTQDASFIDSIPYKNNNASKSIDSSCSSETYDPLLSLRKAVFLWAEEFNCVSHRTRPPVYQAETKIETPDDSCSLVNTNDGWYAL